MLIIVAFHCDLPPTGGFVALDAFFVISGYVIGGLLLREKLMHGRIRFAHFYMRRVRRLLPALALMLVVVAVLSALLESPIVSQRTTGRVGVYASLSLANLALYQTDAGYFAERSESLLLRHTWSLSVEEQFYAFFPLFLALVLWGNRRRLGWLLAALALVSASSFALLVVMSGASDFPLLHRPQSAAYYLPFTRVWEMAAGVVVAVWHLKRSPLRAGTAWVFGGTGAAITILAVGGFTAESDASSPTLALPVMGTALVLAACRTPGPLARALSWAPLCWVGDRSYGWYLWHWPLIVLARNQWPDSRVPLVAAAIVGLGVSTVTYRVVEQRFRYPRRDVSERQQLATGLRIAAVCVAASVVATGSLSWAASHYWGSPVVRSMAVQLLPWPAVAGPGGCPMPEVLRSGTAAACTEGSGSGPPIYVVGDSNAGQFTAGLLNAGKSLDRPITLLWRAGCPYADVTIVRSAYDVEGCDRHNRQVTQWLTHTHDATVVVANAGEFLNASAVSMRDASTGQVAEDPSEKSQAWQTGLERSLLRLRASGSRVLVLRMLPHPGGVDNEGQPRWSPRACGLLAILGSHNACAINVSLGSENQRQRAALLAEGEALRAAGVAGLNLRSTVCPHATCETRRDDLWIYRDGNHLTERYSAQLGPALALAISRVAWTTREASLERRVRKG